MEEGHTGEPRANQERLTVAQAATRLGITEGAVRSRIKRGTLRIDKEGGAVFVLLGDGTSQANQTTNTGVPGDQSPLIEALRDQIEDLRRERDQWREQARITDRLLSAAMERIPAIEAPQEASGSSETVEETPEGAEPQSATGVSQEGPAEAPSRPRNLLALGLVAPLGPGIAAIMFDVSLWAPSSVQTSVQTWFFVTLVFSLLPAVLGFVWGRSLPASVAFRRARIEEANRSGESSPLEELNEINATLIFGVIVAITTAFGAGWCSWVLRDLYTISDTYQGLVVTPTLVVVPAVSGVLAGLLWSSFAFLGWGVQRQRMPGVRGATRGAVNWQVVVPLIASLSTATATVVAAVLAARITDV